MLDIRDAQIGEDELKVEALETPIIFTPSRNMSPPTVIPRSPDNNSRKRFFLLSFSCLFRNLDIENRNANRSGNRMVLA
jgi:hypothetical protein